MKRFEQTCDWLNIAASNLSVASQGIYKTYVSGELRNYDRIDARIEELRRKAVKLYEEVLNVRAALVAADSDEPLGDVEYEVNEERLVMGLLSQEEEIEHVFGRVEEMPF